MLKLVTGMSIKRGFTLIEILIVLLIIGITLSFALLAFGDFGESRRIVVSAEQFTNYMKLVQQQAMIEANTLGVRINQNGYQALRFKAPDQWQSIPHSPLSKSYHFPPRAVIQLEKNISNHKIPEILVKPSGDLSYFKLVFRSSRNSLIATVSSEKNEIVLQLKKSP